MPTPPLSLLDSALFMAAQGETDRAVGDVREWLRTDAQASPEARRAAEDFLEQASSVGDSEAGALLAAEAALLLGARPKARSGNYSTPLMEAARAGHARLLGRLLPLSEPRATNDGEQTALMMAAMEGRAECLRLLLPHSDARAINSSDQGALRLATWKGHVDCVELLLPFVGALGPMKNGVTHLMIAAENGHADCVKLLLPHDNPRAINASCRSALMMAVTAGSPECIRALLPHSDVFMTNQQGLDAFGMALKFLKLDCADAFAGFVPESRRKQAFAIAPPELLPALHAVSEREALSASLAGAKPDGVAADGLGEPDDAAHVARRPAGRL
jgi:hypothetical protein